MDNKNVRDATLSFKIPKHIDQELSQYVHDHYITKSDFIRNAVIEKLQEIEDSNFINQVISKKGKIYTHKEVMLELGL